MYKPTMLAIKNLKRRLGISKPSAVMSPSTTTPLTDVISLNSPPTLRELLENQDLEIFTAIARSGTPEMADYMLSRSTISEDHTQRIDFPSPTKHPLQFLVRQSAYYSNVPLFRYLLSQNPFMITGYENANVQAILKAAISGGGIPIWEVLLEYNSGFKEVEFHGHHGYVIEFVAESENFELLEYLLKMGTDMDRCGDPVLDVAKLLRVDRKRLEIIEKYSKLQALREED